ncbi:MAG: hypothetical protein GYA21_20070 [Myxococcales bacterium]|nr:hypothetical protein [Myxococcales bacterium]
MKKLLHLFTALSLMGATGCAQDGDRCHGVVCEKPAECQSDTLVTFDGVCRASSGDCEFLERRLPCPHGCAAGRCLSGERACRDDGHADGPPCRDTIEDETQFEALAVGNALTMGTKFMLPAKDDPALLPLVFQNSRRFPLHLCFLCCAFPEKFGTCNCENKQCRDPESLTPQKYMDLIMKRAKRSYFAGAIQRVQDAEFGRIYGFSVWTDSADRAELLEMNEVEIIYDYLRAFFVPNTLAYMPALSDPDAVAKARTWTHPPFPVYLGKDDVRVEVYNPGTAYGTVRLYTLSDFEQAAERGELSFRDIVVVDKVPFDIEAVVAGVVTGARQWELSHVNVRMSRRGTPNLFVKNPLSALEDFAGQLVRLDAEKSGDGLGNYRITPTTLAEAEAFWSSHRPDLGAAPAIERAYRELPALLDIAGEPEATLTTRVGGKAGNLARLLPLLPEPNRVRAFAIPFSHFEDFMEANRIRDERASPPEEVTLREYVRRIAADPRFSSDAAYRKTLLWDLRSRMQNQGALDPALVSALAQRIREVFGADTARVRFRSSSNVEDALEFSGAGLYSSTTVCAADSLDGDRSGPSRCDSTQEDERTIERGLRLVWASLYSDRGVAERDWYQIPQDTASMAILVSESFPDERANGVAFTGNPNESLDDRYLVNAQMGDEAVVGNDPLLIPERDFLTVQDGRVTKIERERASSLAPPGGRVLSDEELTRLGELMAAVDAAYPIDTSPYPRERVLLDLEFKLTPEGVIRIKQIRPFLDKCRNVRCDTPPPPTCRDERTLLDHYPAGSCDAASGECRYPEKIVDCPAGCADGACR